MTVASGMPNLVADMESFFPLLRLTPGRLLWLRGQPNAPARDCNGIR